MKEEVTIVNGLARDGSNDLVGRLHVVFLLLKDTLLSTMHFDKCIESEPCGVTSI